jgi:hypothetical protein
VTEKIRPIDFVHSFLESNGSIRFVQLSSYRRVPGAVREIRSVHRVALESLEERFDDLQRSLGSLEEVAFDSRVLAAPRLKEHAFHVPLVDFASDDARRVRRVSDLLVEENHASCAALFSSGRAYHLYIGTLLSTPEWVQFMGRILLLNQRGKSELVDTRWVGHRLFGGFAALRWSARTKRYRAFGPPLPVKLWGSAAL